MIVAVLSSPSHSVYVCACIASSETSIIGSVLKIEYLEFVELQ